jgi:Uma2 family endonuclease
VAVVQKNRSGANVDAELHNGDSMTQSEFHIAYNQMPEGYKAELIGGVVFVCEPLGLEHGCNHAEFSALFVLYKASTPGVQVCDNTTVILGKKDEVQPDLFLRVLPAYKGQSRDKQGKKGVYVEGAPELIAEVAHTSKSIDLHLKKQRYTRAGVLEYVVLCLNPKELRWFDLRNNFELSADNDGVFRSIAFPGLWIDSTQLLRDQYHPLMDTLNRGLASAEHADFVARLAAARLL